MKRNGNIIEFALFMLIVGSRIKEESTKNTIKRKGAGEKPESR